MKRNPFRPATWLAFGVTVALSALLMTSAEAAALKLEAPPPGAHADAALLADHPGKVVLVNFWATWCAPCIKELPSLERLQAKSQGTDLAVVALSVDRGAEGGAKARDMLKRLQLEPLGFHQDGDNAVMRGLKIEVMPTTVLFDRSGHEVGRVQGPAEWDKPEAAALLKSVLEKKD